MLFKNDAEEIKPVPVSDPNNAPQGPVYFKKKELLEASNLEDALK